MDHPVTLRRVEVEIILFLSSSRSPVTVVVFGGIPFLVLSLLSRTLPVPAERGGGDGDGR